jgi:deoxyribose-phosphate aldolase
MELQKILSAVDHTILSPDCTWDQVRSLCDDAIVFQTASVCIPPSFVRRAKEYVGDRMKVCTVVGFPNAMPQRMSKFSRRGTLCKTAPDEIDMVINVGALKEGALQAVEDEIRAVRAACEGRTLKVIIETCLLTEAEKIAMCQIVTETGADYIKTSTGFSKGGATFEDVALLKRHIGSGVKVKASGGIKTLEEAERYIALGASRLGTSRVVALAKKLADRKDG